LFEERDEEDDADPDDGPPVTLNSRRSVQLFNLARMFPGVPIFPGAITDWPIWFIEDYQTLSRFEGESRKNARRDKQADDWAETERRKMKAESAGTGGRRRKR
jgi:hypothetical protein